MNYILSHRGKNGGLTLGRDASSINIAEVVRDCESNFNLLECFDPANNTCPITKGCLLKPALREAQTAFMDALIIIL